MAQRMDTLDGAISNLGDEWDKLWLNISNLGVGSLVTDSVRMAIDIIGELNAMLASGQTEAYLSAIAGQFDNMGRDIVTTVGIIAEYWNDFLGTSEGEGLAGATQETIAFIIDAFKNMPTNIRTVIQLMAVEIAALVDYGQAYGQAFADVIGVEFGKLVEKSKAYGQAIGDAINPFSDDEFDLEARLQELDSLAAGMANDAFARAEKQAEVTREARRSSIVGIMEEKDAATASFDAQIKKSDELRDAYDKQLEARKSSTTDALAGFGIAPTSSADSVSAGVQSEPVTTDRSAEFENLVESLRSEEDVIQESYNRRLAIILENTAEGSEQQKQLKAKLDEEFAEQVLSSREETNDYDTQLEELQEYYDARKELILDNAELTEEARTELEVALTEERLAAIQTLEDERNALVKESAQSMADSLTSIASDLAGEQSETYKAMFAVSKAFAIADSIVAIQTGIAEAAANPWPANLAAMASVAAATASIVSTISSTEFSGTYDNGGTIPQGKVGLVGEFGPELVSGPANVRSRRETADMIAGAQDSGSQGSTGDVNNNLRIVNNIDPSVMADYMGSSAGEDVIMNTIKNNPESVRRASSF